MAAVTWEFLSGTYVNFLCCMLLELLGKQNNRVSCKHQRLLFGPFLANPAKFESCVFVPSTFCPRYHFRVGFATTLKRSFLAEKRYISLSPCTRKDYLIFSNLPTCLGRGLMRPQPAIFRVVISGLLTNHTQTGTFRMGFQIKLSSLKLKFRMSKIGNFMPLHKRKLNVPGFYLRSLEIKGYSTACWTFDRSHVTWLLHVGLFLNYTKVPARRGLTQPG